MPKISDFNPSDLSLVQSAPAPKHPLKLSDIDPSELTLVQDAPTQAQSAARGAASGFTGGFDDEIIGGLDAAGRIVGIKNLGSAKHLNELSLAAPTLDKNEIMNAYRSGRDSVRADERQDMESNPGTTIAANIGGALVSPIGEIGPEFAAAKDATKLQKLGAAVKTGIAKGAIQGGIYGAGGSNADLTQGEVGQFAKDTALGSTIGGVIGGATPVVISGVSEGADLAKKGAKWVGAKTLSNAGGVSPDVIKEYAQFSDRINNAPTPEKLKELSDDFVGKLSDDVEAKKITSQQAKDAYAGFQSDLKDAYRTAGYDARDAVNSAQQTLKDAHGARLQQMSGDVYDTINKLKSEVQSGSVAALKTLDKSGASVDLAPVYSAIDSNIDSLNKAGTDEAMAVASKLQDYKSRLLSNNWANVPAPDAKKLIQGLDQTTEYSPMAGSFDKAKNSAFKSVRSALDQSLKSSVPEYAEAMKPVADNADLLNRVSDFGDRQQAVNLLKNINAPNQLERRAAIQELGQKYGADFIAGAQPENLPESRFLQNAQARMDALRPDRVSENIDQKLASSRQKSAMDEANASYEASKQKLAPFKPLAPNISGQTQAQQKLTQLATGKNIEINDMFKKLGNLTNTDFVQAMHDHQIQAAFTKGATNGSRNTMFGAVMGALAGYLFGGAVGAGAGVSAGVSAGRAVDQWGPAITKKILDGVIRLSKNPNIETIQALDLPEPIKKNMVIGLRNYLAKAPADAGGSLPAVASSDQKANRSPAKGEDLWAQNGLKKLGIQDPAQSQRLMQDPKAKQLLIQASDLAPGSKAMQKIIDQIQKGYSK